MLMVFTATYQRLATVPNTIGAALSTAINLITQPLPIRLSLRTMAARKSTRKSAGLVGGGIELLTRIHHCCRHWVVSCHGTRAGLLYCEPECIALWAKNRYCYGTRNSSGDFYSYRLFINWYWLGYRQLYRSFQCHKITGRGLLNLFGVERHS